MNIHLFIFTFSLVLFQVGALVAQEKEPSKLEDAATSEPAPPKAVKAEAEKRKAAEKQKKIEEESKKDTTPQASEEKSDVPPKTIVADPGFGENRIQQSLYFPEESLLGQVDRRHQIDPMSDHTILIPSAFVPEQFSTTFTNSNIFLNTLSFSITDHLQLSATINFPSPTTNFMFNFSGKLELIDDPNYIVSVQPFVSYQAGDADLDIATFGIGAGALADFYLSDRWVLSTGSHLFLNTLLISDNLNYDSCETHQDYLSGDCIDNTSSKSFPSGGHWWSLNAAMTYYIYDSLSLRLEAISGLTLGSFLGSEYLDGEDSFSAKRKSFTDPSLSIGVPRNSPLTLGMGVGWALKNVGIQASIYMWQGRKQFTGTVVPEKQILFSPIFSVSAGF